MEKRENFPLDFLEFTQSNQGRSQKQKIGFHIFPVLIGVTQGQGFFRPRPGETQRRTLIHGNGPKLKEWLHFSLGEMGEKGKKASQKERNEQQPKGMNKGKKCEIHQPPGKLNKKHKSRGQEEKNQKPWRNFPEVGENETS